MAASTAIAWTDSTFNPWIGCTKVGPGCDHCYAEALDARYQWGGATHWGVGIPRRIAGDEAWRQPLRWNKAREDALGRFAFGSAPRPAPHRVFCASLADVFDNEVPRAWRSRLWAAVRTTPCLTWQILTKRIGAAAAMLPSDWADGYPNVWIGATMVNQEEVDRDLGKLVRTAARTRFVSLEPLLGPLSLNLDGVDWVIVGGESGPNRREMDVRWIEGVVEQCKAARVPVFVKQDSGPRPGMKGRIPDELWLKKEFPELSITRSSASPMPECGASAS